MYRLFSCLAVVLVTQRLCSLFTYMRTILRFDLHVADKVFFWFVPAWLCFMYPVSKLDESQRKPPRSQMQLKVAGIIFLC